MFSMLFILVQLSMWLIIANKSEELDEMGINFVVLFSTTSPKVEQM